MTNGLDYFTSADLFEAWFLKLGLPFRKKIIPLGQNYVFDRDFIIDWLGYETYSQFFAYDYRDTLVTAHYLNDKADAYNEMCPFPKANLKYLASQLKVSYEGAHDALHDCLITAKIYKAMLMLSHTLDLKDPVDKLLAKIRLPREGGPETISRLLRVVEGCVDIVKDFKVSPQGKSPLKFIEEILDREQCLL
jgi:DNA polymerase III epsilon subunit-like protein